MEFEIQPGYDALEEIAALFAEYTGMLVASDPEFKRYLDVQGYDAEAANPGHKYAMPGGRLYLARHEGKPVACAALRRIDDRRCEMKRLYVRPEFHGNHLGRILVEKILTCFYLLCSYTK